MSRNNTAFDTDTPEFLEWLPKATLFELLRMADNLSGEVYEANDRLLQVLREIAKRQDIQL